MKGLFVQTNYEIEILITEKANYWLWEYPKYNKETYMNKTWQNTYRYLKLMLSMNKFHEETRWQQIKEKTVGLRYRLELERRILDLLKELQIKLASKLWSNK